MSEVFQKFTKKREKDHCPPVSDFRLLIIVNRICSILARFEQDMTIKDDTWFDQDMTSALT